MKKLIKTLGLVIIFTVVPFAMMAQTPPHPNGGSAPGSGNTPVGGGAPIGGGLVIMMLLGSGYAARKTFNLKKADSDIYNFYT